MGEFGADYYGELGPDGGRIMLRSLAAPLLSVHRIKVYCSHEYMMDWC